jgi:hypothetical protein
VRGAWTIGRGTASACVYGRYGGMPTRPSASSAGDVARATCRLDFEINLALFEMSKLEISLQKWTKAYIAKL